MIHCLENGREKCGNTSIKHLYFGAHYHMQVLKVPLQESICIKLRASDAPSFFTLCTSSNVELNDSVHDLKTHLHLPFILYNHSASAECVYICMHSDSVVFSDSRVSDFEKIAVINIKI